MEVILSSIALFLLLCMCAFILKGFYTFSRWSKAEAEEKINRQKLEQNNSLLTSQIQYKEEQKAELNSTLQKLKEDCLLIQNRLEEKGRLIERLNECKLEAELKYSSLNERYLELKQDYINTSRELERLKLNREKCNTILSHFSEYELFIKLCRQLHLSLEEVEKNKYFFDKYFPIIQDWEERKRREKMMMEDRLHSGKRYEERFEEELLQRFTVEERKRMRLIHQPIIDGKEKGDYELIFYRSESHSPETELISFFIELKYASEEKYQLLKEKAEKHPLMNRDLGELLHKSRRLNRKYKYLFLITNREIGSKEFREHQELWLHSSLDYLSFGIKDWDIKLDSTIVILTLDKAFTILRVIFSDLRTIEKESDNLKFHFYNLLVSQPDRVLPILNRRYQNYMNSFINISQKVIDFMRKREEKCLKLLESNRIDKILFNYENARLLAEKSINSMEIISFSNQFEKKESDALEAEIINVS